LQQCPWADLVRVFGVSFANQPANAVSPPRLPAVEAIHRLAHGWPRRINRMCDLALLIGFAEDRKTITDAEIEAFSQELVSVSPE
jgi:hypothetical protein